MSEWRLRAYRGKYAAVRSVNGKTERVSLRTDDLDEAKRQLADFLRKPSGETVADLMTVYLADKRKTAIRWKDLEGSWKQAAPSFAHLRPDQITREVCRAYRDARYKAGKKPATVRKELETVRAGVRFSKRDGQSVFELPPQPRPKERYLTRDEARALLQAARKFPHVKAFIALSLATGARQTALLDLTWDRVDFRRRTISLALNDELDASRKRRATVPMTKRAYRYLRVLHALTTSDYVIEWGGRRVHSIKKGFAAAADRAGMPDVTPHILRHTAASWMAERGIPMFQIAKYLGHTDSRITEKRYAKLSPDYLKDAAEALDY